MKRTLALIGFFVPSIIALAMQLSGCGDDSSTPEVDGSVTPDTSTGDTGNGPDTSVTDSGSNDAGDAADSYYVPPPGPEDRMGRAGINTALIGTNHKDLWNKTDTVAAAATLTFDNDLQTHLVSIDMLDGVNDWNGGPIPADAGPDADGGGLAHPLGKPLKLDMLVVDTAKPYGANGYLEIENEVLLGGAAHQTCGGRTPNEDVMDKTLSLLVKKQLTGVSDNVNAATKPAPTTWPYLADPN